LLDVEGKLSEQALNVARRCKDAAQGHNKVGIEALLQEAEALWLKHGDRLGQLVATLWLVDWYLREKPDEVHQYAKKVMEQVPSSGQPPEYSLVRAVALYLFGQSQQKLGEGHQAASRIAEAANAYLAASDAYQDIPRALEEALDYWNRIGDSRAGSCKQVLEQIKKLIEYVCDLRSKLPPPPPPSSPSPPTSSGPRSPYSVEFTQLPVLREPIHAGAPRDLTTLLLDMGHDSIAADQLLIENRAYSINPLRGSGPVRVTSGQRYVAIPVKGNSMVDSGILQDDYVVLRILKESEKPCNGDIVAAEEAGDNEVTLKQYIVSGGRRYLQARNTNSLKWRNYNCEIDDNVVIRGIAIAILRPL
jgi:hypothetical protein